MVRVLIADDEALLRKGLRAVLAAHDGLEVVAEAADGEQAVDLALRDEPDVVLMDLRMPRVDGLEATRRLQAAGSPARVLVVTTFDADEHVRDALSAGASGFLLKAASPDRLADAVRRTAAGETVLDPEVTRRLAERLLVTPVPDPEVRHRLAGLTEREGEVLGLLARGFSNADIAGRLSLAEGTVKTHVTNLLAKLGLRSRLQAVVLAYEHGLVRAEALSGASWSPARSPGT